MSESHSSAAGAYVIPPLRPKRAIRGMSAILLPFRDDGVVDWDAFSAHVARTVDAGLTPAVNMDTGYVNLLTREERLDVLRHTRSVLGGRPFVAGAFVGDRPGALFDAAGYLREIAAIHEQGGAPVIFQSYGLAHRPAAEIIANYEQIAHECPRFYGFELTPALAPFGCIYPVEVFRALLEMPECVGAKHSSFQRQPEWDRLTLRDAVRPDFQFMTGNDFAIDMVMYGSDYLLGLSTFAPDAFALRDRYWAAGDPRFLELNDELQYLGRFAFRTPGSAYKHSAAQFLKLRGWIACDRTHPNSGVRPQSDVAVLDECRRRLESLLAAS